MRVRQLERYLERFSERRVATRHDGADWILLENFTQKTTGALVEPPIPIMWA